MGRGRADRLIRLEVDGVVKRYGVAEVLRGVSFAATPGRVTALLGPNGAGKSTTLGILLGLIHPTRGRALIDGVPYARLPNPLAVVGAVLDGARPHPARTPREHLSGVALAAGLDPGRVTRALEQVGLQDQADKPCGLLSLGMGQRLGLATALLGEPAALVLDEPANGLDPPSRRWLRNLLRDFARAGGTVLLSTHLLTEAELLADSAVVLHKGAVLASGPVAEIAPVRHVEAETNEPERLLAALHGAGFEAHRDGAVVIVHHHDPEDVGAVVARHGIVLRRLDARSPTLEQAFLELVRTPADNGPATHAPAV